MIVLDLIKKHSPKEIINAVIKSDSNKFSPYKPANIAELFANAVFEIWDLEPVETDYILVGIMSYEEAERGADALLTPRVYKKTDLENEYNFPAGLCENTDITTLSANELFRFIHKISCIEWSDCIHAPWAEVLGYNLIDESMKDIDTLALVVAIIEQMTLGGFSASDVTNRSAEIVEMLEEDARKIDEDIQSEKTVYALEDFLEEFRARHGFFDNRSAEEKERENLLYWQRVLKDQIEIYKCLKKYNLCKFNLV